LLATTDDPVQRVFGLAGICFLRITQLAGLVDFIATQTDIGSRYGLIVVVSNNYRFTDYSNLAALLRAIVLIRQQTCLEAIRRLHPKVLQQITDADVTLIVAELTVARREGSGGRPRARVQSCGAVIIAMSPHDLAFLLTNTAPQKGDEVVELRIAQTRQPVLR
jgi:hypothetical protein